MTATAAPLFLIVLTSSVFTANANANATELSITRLGATPSEVAQPAYYTGSVRVDSRFHASAPARVGGALVTFEPGARTAWHKHPLGQTLMVMTGVGRLQVRGGPVEEIRAGDVVWTPPGVEHWHGASPDIAMSHLAISERLDGEGVDWLEKVSDEEYLSTTTKNGEAP